MGKEFMANSYSYKKSVDQMKKKEVIEIEEDDKEKQYEDPDLNADHRLKSTPKNHKKKFSFNIADAGFTELHTLWQTEEAAAISKARLKEIWHRMHDYWLLAGIAKHGYSRWGDIAADPQFSLVQQPFLAMDKRRDNVLDMQKGFLQRRFKLLESALIEEEQLRRAQIEKMNTIDNEEWLSMQRNFNELDAIAQAHAYLTNPEILKENKIGTFVLQKTLLKMEELLNALKQDLAKLPMVISGWGQVQDRLQMNERYTVAHLLTASANLTENDGTQPESAESRDQREQFKQLAKNTHVAKALRFCNETGSFFIGKGVKLDSFEMPNGDIVEVPASESNGEEGKDACESEENN